MSDVYYSLYSFIRNSEQIGGHTTDLLNDFVLRAKKLKL